MNHKKNHNTYKDIINSPRPISKRPKMSLEKRAKIFQPFQSLGELDYNTPPEIYRKNLRLTPTDTE